MQPFLLIALVGLLAMFLLYQKEGYADQVIHAGVGGIAGPMGRYLSPSGEEEIPTNEMGMRRWYY